MNKGRLEAFSDGVIAIIITIMVLEIKVPHDDSIQALKPMLPVFLSYILSFIYVGIYWNNHHHMFQLVKHVNGKVLWKNMHLLFWLSLIPFATGWMGENHFSKWPVIVYGSVLMMCAVAYALLVIDLRKLHEKDSPFAIAIGKDVKGKISMLFYFVGIPLSFVSPWLGILMYVIVACIWFIPDRRVEKRLIKEEH
ncbi:MAG: TMEM175 family protein [Ferruginibacter sp.]